MGNLRVCASERAVPGTRRGGGRSGAKVEVATLDFSEIVRRHGAALYRRACWLAKSESDAADLFQDTIERALRGARRRIEPPMVGRWLLTIMHNAFIDQRRARAARVVAGDFPIEALSSHEPVDAGESSHWRRVDDEALSACCDRLPRKLRQIFQLHASGASYAEVALHVGIPIATVGTRLWRARRRLRRMLAESVGGEVALPPARGPARVLRLRRPNRSQSNRIFD